MSAKLREHLRSNVVGYIALFCFAIAGTAQALPGKNTVDSADIKNHQVKKKDLANDSVGGGNVIDGSLTAADLDAAALKSILATGVVSSVQLADGTIVTANLADGSVTTPKLADRAVTAPKLASNAVEGSNVVNQSLTSADLAGADVSGSVSLGAVPNGRCSQVTISVGGAAVGDVALIATEGPLQNGVLLYGQRVESAGHVEADICNFSGTTMTTITELPIHVITFH
jgi:hypothetical protein